MILEREANGDTVAVKVVEEDEEGQEVRV